MSLKKWQVQTAKNKLSEVIQQAMEGEPQLITKNGRPAVYVIDYAGLAERSRRIDLVENHTLAMNIERYFRRRVSRDVLPSF